MSQREVAETDQSGFGISIGGRFTILEAAGVGGMGWVYKAHDRSFNQIVALKMLFPHLVRNADTRSRFRNEVLIARRLSHPNIVRTYNFDSLDGHDLLTMEFVEGRSLASCIPPGGLPPDRVLAIVAGTLRALAHAHSHGVVHCDLKPANILLTNDGTPKVADFGISQLLSQRAGHHGATVVGTPRYMAPEQLSGGLVDFRTDLYSVGALAFEVCCGSPPFAGDSLFELAEQHRSAHRPSLPRGHVPPPLASLIRQLLAVDPAERPPSPHAALRSLESLLPPEEIVVRDEVAPTAHVLASADVFPARPSRWARLSPVVKTTVIIGVLGLLARFGMFVVETNEATRRRMIKYTLIAERALDARFPLLRLLFHFDGLDGHSQQELSDIMRDRNHTPGSVYRQGEFIWAIAESGIDMHFADASGDTYLHTLISKGAHPRTAQLLIDHGAPVNARNTRTGETALARAVEHSTREIAMILLARGADPNIPDFDGATPLHRAAAAQQDSLVALLLANGADPNAKDKRGDTPVHAAVRSGKRLIVLRLLLRGGDPLALNARGETPRSTAKTRAAENAPGAAEIDGVIEQALSRRRADPDAAPVSGAASG